MTKYRLPEDLGGGEVFEVERDPAFQVDGRHGAIVRTAAGTVLAVARDRLTEVEPSLPSEPPTGSVVLVGADASHPDSGSVFRHYTYGWCAPGDEGDYLPWAVVCGGGSPVLLVPNPFAERVKLPWRQQVGRHTTVAVERTGIDEIGLDVCSGGYSVSPGITDTEARDIARALWTAAASHEATP